MGLEKEIPPALQAACSALTVQKFLLVFAQNIQFPVSAPSVHGLFSPGARKPHSTQLYCYESMSKEAVTSLCLDRSSITLTAVACRDMFHINVTEEARVNAMERLQDQSSVPAYPLGKRWAGTHCVGSLAHCQDYFLPIQLMLSLIHSALRFHESSECLLLLSSVQQAGKHPNRRRETLSVLEELHFPYLINGSFTLFMPRGGNSFNTP